MGHEVADGVGVRVAEIWHVIAWVALHAVLDPDFLAGQLPGNGLLLFEVDAVLSQPLDEPGVAGELVVVVSWDERDLYVCPRGPQLLEELCVIPDEQVELLRSLRADNGDPRFGRLFRHLHSSRLRRMGSRHTRAALNPPTIQ